MVDVNSLILNHCFADLAINFSYSQRITQTKAVSMTVLHNYTEQSSEKTFSPAFQRRAAANVTHYYNHPHEHRCKYYR